jgi:hypothetical protein
MFKNRFLIVLGVVSLLLATMAVSRLSSSASEADGASDFYQRHRDWNRNLEGSDYYDRHRKPSATTAIGDIAGDFALRHPNWMADVQTVAIPVTGDPEASDYFQRHPEFRLPSSPIDLSDYFLRH